MFGYGTDSRYQSPCVKTADKCNKEKVMHNEGVRLRRAAKEKASPPSERGENMYGNDAAQRGGPKGKDEGKSD